MKTPIKISEPELGTKQSFNLEDLFASVIQNPILETRYMLNSNADVRPLEREEKDYFGLSIRDASGFRIYEE